MQWSFFLNSRAFVHFSWEHAAPLLVIALITWLVILYARKKDRKTQDTVGLIMALIPCVFVLLRMGITAYEGSFTIQKELPLHLCRICALMAPWVMFKRHRYWLGVFYFWILVGTMNANITPDLQHGFPHYDYIIFFTIHGFLNALPFYAIFVYGLRIRWKDIVNTFWITNAYMLITLVVNYFLGSNYFYTMEKPKVASFLDYMGPWPYYILVGEVIIMIFFLLFYLPFYLTRKSRPKGSEWAQSVSDVYPS